MDFTLQKYTQLLEALSQSDYQFVTFSEYCTQKNNDTLPKQFVIMRHDVDLRPKNSLATAQIEQHLAAKAVYYFRAVLESWDEQIIRNIAALGHEVGYHYESLTTCRGDGAAAYADFCKNLSRLRQLTEVTTICMHGSPRSPYDSKDIWKEHDYRQLGIVGEPYCDANFSEVLYLTDTGRCWDGYNVSVRDKIPVYQEEWQRRGWTFHTTDQLISALKNRALPPKLMITTHPQRWTDNKLLWSKELLLQLAKNQVKKYKIKLSNK